MLHVSKHFPALLTAAACALSAPQAHAASPPPVLACTVILDAASGKTLLRKGTCDQGVSPASTFKIPLAVMGYDAGVLKDEHSPVWDYKAEFNALKKDQKSVDPTIWEKDSIVWFSRQITRQLGADVFASYVTKFGYGNKDVTGDAGKNNGLTNAWLASSLKISPDEQVQFVRRLLAGTLPASEKAHAMTRAILPVFKSGDSWTVHGKTGSIWLRDKSGAFDKNRPIGWFVGWAESGDRRIVFARLEIGSEETNVPKSFQVRDSLLKDLPELMKQAQQ
jgi:beta-lactamase class D